MYWLIGVAQITFRTALKQPALMLQLDDMHRRFLVIFTFEQSPNLFTLATLFFYRNSHIGV